MEFFSETRRYRNSETYSPGIVGSVGDAISTTRLKQTEGNLRYASNAGRGTYVQDGSTANRNGYGPSTVIDDTFSGKRRRRVCNGYRYQDLRVPETSVDVRLTAIPQYTWKSHVATTQAALTRGLRYQMPGGYGPSRIKQPRGGLYPRLVQTYTGEEYINMQTPLEYTSGNVLLSNIKTPLEYTSGNILLSNKA